MAAPGVARGLPESRMEPVRLRDEDGGGPERAAELADEPQLDTEPTDGKPERDAVRRSDDAARRRRRRSDVGRVASGKIRLGFKLGWSMPSNIKSICMT